MGAKHSLEQGTAPEPIRLDEVLEALSIASVASFLASAMFNAVTFWGNFHLNYFSIAQPSDIIMSSFINVTSVLLIVTFFGAAGQLLLSWGYKRFYRPRWGRTIRALSAFLLGLALPLMAYIANSIRVGNSPVALSTHGINGLVLAPNGPFSAMCGPAPILWLGSASAVVNCHGKPLVISNTESLAMMRP